MVYHGRDEQSTETVNMMSKALRRLSSVYILVMKFGIQTKYVRHYSCASGCFDLERLDTVSEELMTKTLVYSRKLNRKHGMIPHIGTHILHLKR